MNRTLSEHLAASDGLVSNAQARALGVSPRQLEGLVHRGELERMHRGVYRNTSTPLSERQRWMAGLIAVGTSGVLSHRSAIAAHEAPHFRCSLAELTVRSRAKPLRDGLITHRSTTLTAIDVTRLGGMAVTTMERTAIDGCTVLPPLLVVRFVEHWLASRALQLDRLHECIERLSSPPGAAALKRALDDRTLGAVVADSPAESRLGDVLVGAGLRPEHHVLVTTAVGHTFELDWAFPSARIGLEMDGYGIHMRSVEAFDQDRFRRNELENDGWQILNFTERQVRRTPHVVVEQVQVALSRRVVHLDGG